MCGALRCICCAWLRDARLCVPSAECSLKCYQAVGSSGLTNEGNGEVLLRRWDQRSGFSSPRAFRRWSRKFRSLSVSLANCFFVGLFSTSNPDVFPYIGIYYCTLFTITYPETLSYPFGNLLFLLFSPFWRPDFSFIFPFGKYLGGRSFYWEHEKTCEHFIHQEQRGNLSRI